MLEKYKNISEFYKEPYDTIIKVLNRNNIYYTGGLIRELERLSNERVLHKKFNSYGDFDISIEKKDFINRIRCSDSKQDLINNVLKDKKFYMLSSEVMLKIAYNSLKRSFPDAELILEDNAVVIHYPELTISNSKGITHKLLDVYVRYSLYNKRLIPSIFRTTYTYPEASYDYSHSHYSGTLNRFRKITNFCLGTNPLAPLLEKGASTITEVKLLIKAVHELLIWESLEGGPYRYLSKLHKKSVEFIPQIPIEYNIDELYLKFLKYLSNRSGILYVNDNKVEIIDTIVDAFLESTEDERFYGHFVKSYKDTAKIIKKEFTKNEISFFDTYSETIGGKTITTKLIPLDDISNVVINKVPNKLVKQLLINKINKDLDETFEYVWKNHSQSVTV